MLFFYCFESSQVKVELHELGKKVLQVAIEGKRCAMGEFVFNGRRSKIVEPNCSPPLVKESVLL